MKLVQITIKIIKIKSDIKESLIAYFDHLKAREGNWDEEREKREEKKKKKKRNGLLNPNWMTLVNMWL